MAQEGSKIWLFLGQNRRILARVLWGDDPTWKLFHEPYHISLHARHYVGLFMTFQGTPMVQKGSKIWLFLGQIELLLQACYGVKTSAKLAHTFSQGSSRGVYNLARQSLLLDGRA